MPVAVLASDEQGGVRYAPRVASDTSASKVVRVVDAWSCCFAKELDSHPSYIDAVLHYTSSFIV